METKFKRIADVFNTFIALSRLSVTEPEEWCADIAPSGDGIQLGVWSHEDGGRRVVFEVLREDVEQLAGMTSTPARIKAFRKGGADFEMADDYNERMGNHAAFVRGLLAQAGATFARPLFQEWDNSPLLVGTVMSVNVREQKPLAGVTPTDANGKPQKNAMVGHWEFEIETADGAVVSIIAMSASMKNQLQALTPDRPWDSRTLVPESLRQTPAPDLVGCHLFIMKTGRWSRDGKDGDAFDVGTFKTREDAVSFWRKYQDAMMAQRVRRRAIVATTEYAGDGQTHRGEIEP